MMAARRNTLVLKFSGAGVEHLLDGHYDCTDYQVQMIYTFFVVELRLVLSL